MMILRRFDHPPMEIRWVSRRGTRLGKGKRNGWIASRAHGHTGCLTWGILLAEIPRRPSSICRHAWVDSTSSRRSVATTGSS